MTAGLAAILVIAGVLLLGGLGLFWWINRPINTSPQRATTLPLFASDRLIAPMPIEDVDPPAPRETNEMSTTSTITPKDVAAMVQGSDAPARPVRFTPPQAASPQITGAASARLQLETSAAPQQPVARPTPAPTAPRHTPQSVPRATPTPPRAIAAADSEVTGKSVRFSIPTDGTLQFLPGRLEITAGEDQGREIRFVRLPDLPSVRVTFGRVDGPLYRHVQLNMATVSRKHAIMEYEQGQWFLTNLSTTNPVVLNDRHLGEREKVALADNDRVEMGEVVFRYRER